MDSGGKLVSRARTLSIALLILLVLTVTTVTMYYITRTQHKYNVILTADMQSSSAITPYNGTLVAARQFYQLLHQLDDNCTKLVTLGGTTCNRQPRAQLKLCLDPQATPPKQSCVAYSFGVTDELIFEQELLDALNCTLHMFDPAEQASYPIPIYTEGTDFIHPVGLEEVPDNFVPRIGQSNIDWNVVRLILSEYKQMHPTIHILKLDMHGADWESMEQLSSLGLLDRVDQLSLGVHTLPLKSWPYDTWTTRLQRYQDILTQVSSAGLRKVLYTEDYGNLALVQMPNEDRPRQACGRVLYVRRHSAPPMSS